MNTINHVIFCIIDDVQSAHFFELIEKDYLPNFKELLTNGILSRNCITDFPAITYPTQDTMITGTYTGNYLKEPCHGVPLYYWMDRGVAPPRLRDYGTYGSNQLIQIYKMNEDLGYNCRTLPELIKEGNSASIVQFINRGVDYSFPERKRQLIIYYLMLSHFRNRIKHALQANLVSIKKLLALFEKPKQFFGSNEAPLVSLLLFFSSDVLMHLYGYDSKFYKLNLIHIDKMMGFLVKTLKKLGYFDETAIIIASDHGNYQAKTIGDLGNFLSKNGLKSYYPRKYPKGNTNIAEFGGIGFLNFKSQSNYSNIIWRHPNLQELECYGPKKVNLLKRAFSIKGVRLMYYRDDENTYRKGKIHLRAKDTKAGQIRKGTIEYRGVGKDYMTKYTMENTNDVFNYFEDEIASKLIDGKFHTIDEWLEATNHLDFPLYPDLIPRHFKNPRSADIIVSTCGDIIYNINHGKKKKGTKYTHDIGLRSNSVVPLIISGSNNIPISEITYCKTTDIVPTIVKMLGLKTHESLIGKSLV
ncbi:MAG: alkaline phosphatase family protein [Candidatus Thorarchaeota archaeon]